MFATRLRTASPNRLPLNLLTIAAVLLGSSTALEAGHQPNRLTESQRRSGWKLLFDGKTTAGWRNYRKKTIGAGWKVQNGALARAGRGAGDIVTVDQYEYFELALEYKISKGGNSGIMFHVTEELGAPWQTGPEIQVQDNIGGHDPQKSGWLYQLYKPVKPPWAIRFENQVGYKSPNVDDATRPPGQWNHVYLRIHPSKCEVAINGVSYYYFQKGSKDWDARVKKSKFARYKQFGKPTRGHICLQDHGNPVEFRNITIRTFDTSGGVKDPIDGSLPLQVAQAFPKLKWEGWEGSSPHATAAAACSSALKAAPSTRSMPHPPPPGHACSWTSAAVSGSGRWKMRKDFSDSASTPASRPTASSTSTTHTPAKATTRSSRNSVSPKTTPTVPTRTPNES